MKRLPKDGDEASGMRRWKIISLITAAALLDCAAFTVPTLFPFAWVAKVPALAALRLATPRRALYYGWLYGFFASFAGYHWLIGTTERYAKIPSFPAAILVVGYAVWLGGMFALLFWGTCRAKRDLGIAPCWSLMILYPAIEFAYPNFLHYNVGASQIELPELVQIVDVTGILGLTALVGAVNGGLFEFVEARIDRRNLVHARWAVPAVTLGLVVLYGSVRIRQLESAMVNAPVTKVLAIQSGNLVAHEEDGKQRRPSVAKFTRSILESHPEVNLVVWPESAIIAVDRDGSIDPLGQSIENQWVVAGARVLKSGLKRTTNSLLSISPGGEVVSRYDKIRLIPFGETLPLAGRWPWLWDLFGRNPMVEPGNELAGLDVEGRTFLPIICYEDILPRFVRKGWRRVGNPSALINVSNDSSFGDSVGPRMHLTLARFRSIETRRTLIRATNTGISAIVDPTGKILPLSLAESQEWLIANAPLYQTPGPTLYLRIGDLVGWVALALTLAGVLAIFFPGLRKICIAS